VTDHDDTHAERPSDLHVHTSLSHDGDGTADECCAVAVRLGLATIGFAEHVDFDPADPGYGAFRYEACAEAVLQARARYAGALRVLFGVEVDYQEWLEEAIAEFLGAHAFDYVIGSVHAIRQVPVMSDSYCALRSARRAYSDYYDAVRRSAASGLFDVIGHFGYAERRGAARYGPADDDAVADVVASALTEVVRSGACLEVNAAGLRHGRSEMYPDAATVALFRSLGGRWVSMGSDAHAPADVGLGVAQSLVLTREMGLAVPGHLLAYGRSRRY
jgi:histidinol-phosphatase (PHP family)